MVGIEGTDHVLELLPTDGLSASFDPGQVSLREVRGPELEAVAQGLGLTPAAVAGDACVASKGRPRLLLPVRSRPVLAGLPPAAHGL
ncbi:hypothetical protein KCMC57_up01750 [Kitasatospora sp. CMC57]